MNILQTKAIIPIALILIGCREIEENRPLMVGGGDKEPIIM